MPLQIIRNDITQAAADAIVSTANPRPVIGSGTDRAIHSTGPHVYSQMTAGKDAPRFDEARNSGLPAPPPEPASADPRRYWA